MPRLRQPVIAKKEELFDSTKVEKPEVEVGEPKEPQLEAVADDTPEVVVEEPKQEEPKQDDAALALQRQIEALRQSEGLLRRQHEEAIKAASENRDKFVKSQREIIEANEIALDKTRSAAKSDAEKALLDYKNAREAGDTAAEAEALDRLTDAKTHMRAFERDIEELKIRKKELKKERRELKEQATQPEQSQQQQQQNAPHIVAWRQAHPDYFTDAIKYAELNVAWLKSLKEGLEAYSPAQVTRIDELLGLNESRQEAQPEKRQPSIVSAPVSRDIPSSGSGQRQTSRITLTRDQLEAAKVAGITPAEYARQLIKLNEMKANGEYGDRR